MTSPPILYIVAVEHHGIVSYHVSSEPMANAELYVSFEEHNRSKDETIIKTLKDIAIKLYEEAKAMDSFGLDCQCMHKLYNRSFEISEEADELLKRYRIKDNEIG